MMLRKVLITYILPSLIILLGFFSYFLNYDRVLNFDWSYFNSFGLVLKSIVLEYHRFPVHDPWVCGGIDILSEPQNWVFSPFMITTLFLSPYVANLTSFILLSFIGCWGMYKLLKYYKVSDLISIYCSLLFINSSWFGLHITEGHLTYRDFLLVPLFVYLVLSLSNIKKLFYASILLCFFLLDGGIYTFIYALVLVFFLLLFNMIPIKKLYFDVKIHPITTVLIIIGSLLLSSAKFIPLLTSTKLTGRAPQVEMTMKDIALSLFYPLQTNLDLNEMHTIRFHEIGCYIGILSLAIICFYLLRKSVWRTYSKEILLALIFFWIATGLGGKINPGVLLKTIPLINAAHIESRYFVVFLIFYIVILAVILNRYITSKWLLIVILVVLNLEFLFVRNYSPFIAFQADYNTLAYPRYITKRNLTQTLEYVPKPDVYLLDNIASKECYEPMVVDSNVRHTKERRYKGEAYPKGTRGNVDILEFSPGVINAKYHLWRRTGNLVFNTNSNNSWIVNEPNKIKINSKNLLEVSVANQEGVLKLTYQPWYFYYIISFYLLGLTLIVIIFWRIHQ